MPTKTPARKPVSPLATRFGAMLRAARTRRHMTQEAVAAAAGVTRLMIIVYERGDALPGLDVAVNLARAVSIDLGELVDA